MTAPGKPIIGISLGDPSGIGPEILANALSSTKVTKVLLPLVFGDEGIRGRFKAFSRLATWTAHSSGRPQTPSWCSVTSLTRSQSFPGKPTMAGGKAQLDYVRAT